MECWGFHGIQSNTGRWQAHRVYFLIYNRTIYIGSLIEQNNKMRLRRKGSRSVWICGKNSFNNNICCSQRGNHGLSVITPKTPLVVFEEGNCFLFKLQSNTRVHLFVFLYIERIGSLGTMELLTIQQTVLLRDPQNTLSQRTAVCPKCILPFQKEWSDPIMDIPGLSMSF